VIWLGIDKKKMVDETALLTITLANKAKITKTIAIHAIDPTATDKLADKTMW